MATKKKKQRRQKRRWRGWETRAEGWEARAGAGAGARDADVSQAPGTFFFQCFLYILVTFFHSEMLLDKRTALGRNQDDNDDNYDGNKGWEWWTRAGARDADVSRAPGMFYFYFFKYTLLIFFYSTTTYLPDKRMGGNQGYEEGRDSRCLRADWYLEWTNGNWGDESRGLRHVYVSSPWFFFFFNYIPSIVDIYI